jgi:hypothetical protein
MEAFNGWERSGSTINGEVFNIRGAYKNAIYSCTMKYSGTAHQTILGTDKNSVNCRQVQLV